MVFSELLVYFEEFKSYSEKKLDKTWKFNLIYIFFFLEEKQAYLHSNILKHINVQMIIDINYYYVFLVITILKVKEMECRKLRLRFDKLLE